MSDVDVLEPVAAPVGADASKPAAARPDVAAEPAANVAAEEAVFGKPTADEEAAVKVKEVADAKAKADVDAAEADKNAGGDWPDDWREKFAKGDEKALARLKRYGSPEGVARAFIELERKVSATGLKKGLSDAPTADELAAYRKENGIPDAPEGYELKVPEGLDPSIKGGMDAFAKEMHKINAPPAVVKAAADLYLQAEEKAEQERFDFAQKQTIENKAALKAEFGREFDAEVRRANALVVSTLGETAKDFMATTLADGTKLGDNPDFVRFTAQVARQMADDGVLIADDGGSKGQSIKQEYDDLLGLMTTDNKKYMLPATQSRIAELANKLEQRGWK